MGILRRTVCEKNNKQKIDNMRQKIVHLLRKEYSQRKEFSKETRTWKQFKKDYKKDKKI
jgi:hypothetical protein